MLDVRKIGFGFARRVLGFGDAGQALAPFKQRPNRLNPVSIRGLRLARLIGIRAVIGGS